jgi:acylphosphatase
LINLIFSISKGGYMRRKFLLSNLFKFFLPILLVLFPLISCHKFLAPVVTVAINNTEGAPGDTIVVPIHTSRVTDLNIVSCDVCLAFNDNVLSAVRVVAGDVVPSGWSIESRSSPELIITMDGTEPFKGDGILANMYFVVSNKASPGDTCTLRLQKCEFNKGKILSSLASGLFRVIQKYYGISGYVRQSDGTPIDDVMMVLSGDASDTIYTDSVGYYEFSLTGGDYTVTPSKLYWEFEPSERNYAPLEAMQGNQNYIGTPIAPLTIWVPDTLGVSRDTVNIPINVYDVAGLNVVTCDITLSFGANILTALDASLGELPSGWLIESHSAPGQIVIAMAGTTPLSGSGSLVNIPFVVSSAASSGDTTTIHFVSCSFNEGTVPSNTYGGLFTVDTEYYSISGYVRKSDAAPIADVVMLLSGHASDTVYTDVSGYYEFNSLVTGNYTIKPDKLTWAFEPDSIAYMPLDANQTDQNYIGTPVPSVTIWISDTAGASDDTVVVSVNVPDVTGRSIVSCDITITFNANILTALYASAGDIVPEDWHINNFSTPGQIIIAMAGTTPLSEGGSLVTIHCVVSTAALPDDTTTMHFASCSFNEGAIPADTRDGLFTVIERLYSISGYVKDVAETPIKNVMMVLSGDIADTVYTDVSSYYEFVGLVTGDYTIKTSKQGWIFDPSRRDYMSLNSNQTDQNYTGMPIYSISGYVRNREDAPIENVMMVLSGDTEDTVYTDVSGYYEFVGLVTGDYTITPIKQGWIFDPSHRDYTPLNSDQTDQNYTGIIYSISGYVRNREDAPIENVMMVLTGDKSDTMYTDVSGYYEFGGLVTGDYTITPIKQGWIFDPSYRDYMPLNSDQTGQDYTGMPIYSISGYVKDVADTPIDNVVMVLSGDTTSAVYTNASGYYEFSGLVTGNYKVTPSKIGWTFEPAYREYVSLNANTTDQNFTGILMVHQAIPS